MSHQIIIRGDAEGPVSAEVSYTPSHSMSAEEQGKKVARLIELMNKMYSIKDPPGG